ncbi:MAG: 27 kDa antigen Cfp30B [Gemmatimonadetes bacterium]|nr:27 kDa antigen Cfp30B [Gemmatimonadota bacterium]
MAMEARKANEFCWINMLTPDPDGARAFFTEVLGWTYRDMPGMGHVIQAGGADMGGLFDLNGPNTPPGARAMIGVMVKTDDADASAERVRALGGKAQPPMDIAQNGRMVVVHDPSGANIDLWQEKRERGSSADPGSHGAMSWFENSTLDAAQGREFYTKLFGWTVATMPTPEFEYSVFSYNGLPVAGMHPMTPAMKSGGMKPQWATYFTVDDVDAAFATGMKLGATEMIAPMDIPNIGRMAAMTSPQGVNFYVIKYLPR